MRIFLRQVLPAGPAPQNPENPFQHTAVLDPRAATTAILARFRKQGRDFLPLCFAQQRTRSGHRPSLGAAESAYLSSEKIQLPSFQEPVLGYATASSKKPDLGRSLSSSQVERLTSVPGVMFVNLNPWVTLDFQNVFNPPRDIVTKGALIASCGLVVSIDKFAAHLPA